jgi:predicted DNA-binding ribbon-helix-helix protein
MREASLSNIKNRQLKNSITMTEHKTTIKLASSFHGALNDLKNDRVNKSSKSLIGRLDVSVHLGLRRKPS